LTIREMGELEDTKLTDWTIRELGEQHHVMSQLAGFLNAEGVSMHQSIIKEIEKRGGLGQR
jgi:hypothetical protein